MLLRIAGHAIREGRLVGLEAGAIDGNALVEVVDLFLEVGGMFVVLRSHLIRLQRLGVASQQQQVVYT